MTDGIPSLLRCRWWTAPETSYSSRTDSSTRNGSSANRMHLHGRERFPLQFNPLLRHPRNGHTCRWRGALFGLAISTSHPDPYLFYKGGVRHKKDFYLFPCCLRAPLPIQLQACPHLQTQLLDAVLVPLGLLSHRHLHVKNYSRLLGNTLVLTALTGRGGLVIVYLRAANYQSSWVFCLRRRRGGGLHRPI